MNQFSIVNLVLLRIFLVNTLTIINISIYCQSTFDLSIHQDFDFSNIPNGFLQVNSPLTFQVIYIGEYDSIETTLTYNNLPNRVISKGNNSFIGFTPDNTGQSLGWVTVNHAETIRNNYIGDGGGVTSFRVERDEITGLLNVVDQTLSDGRSGRFFNVDFVNTVGETLGNAGGISSSFDGRIWSAESWYRNNNTSIGQSGIRDTSDFTIVSDLDGWDNITIRKYRNFNWMVEIDPKQAVGIRKQYNWGRAPWEGGIVANDNRTVYMGIDAVPGFWVKFVADKPGDFTEGRVYVYKHDDPDFWVEITSTIENMLDFSSACIAVGGTMYNRIERVAHDEKTGLIYWAETGRDFPGSRWNGAFGAGAIFDPLHIARAEAQGLGSPADQKYRDTYGRIWVFNPFNNRNTVYLEGGPDWDSPESPPQSSYFDTHLSNPDALSIIEIDSQRFLVIGEDLNDTSYGRVPAGISRRMNELYILDLNIENPTHEDLLRITVAPVGAEISGFRPTSDGKSLLISVLGADTTLNFFPFNKDLTISIHGWEIIEIENDCPISVDFNYTICNEKENIEFTDLSIDAGEENGFEYQFFIDNKLSYPDGIANSFNGFTTSFLGFGVYEGKLLVTSPDGCSREITKPIWVYPLISTPIFDTQNNTCTPGGSFDFSYRIPINDSLPSETEYLFKWTIENTIEPSEVAELAGLVNAFNTESINFSYTPISEGLHKATLTLSYDEVGCNVIHETFIDVSSPIELKEPEIRYEFCDDNLTINLDVEASGGTSPYEYLLSNGQEGSSYKDLPNSNYSIKVTDSNGCEFEFDILSELEVDELPALNLDEACILPAPCDSSLFPSAPLELEFTPNGFLESGSFYHFWVKRESDSLNDQIVTFGTGRWGQTNKVKIPSVFGGDSISISIINDLSGAMDLVDCPLEEKMAIPDNFKPTITIDELDTIRIQSNRDTIQLPVNIDIDLSNFPNLCLDDFALENLIRLELRDAQSEIGSNKGLIDSVDNLSPGDTHIFSFISIGRIKVVAIFYPNGFNCQDTKEILVELVE